MVFAVHRNVGRVHIGSSRISTINLLLIDMMHDFMQKNIIGAVVVEYISGDAWFIASTTPPAVCISPDSGQVGPCTTFLRKIVEAPAWQEELKKLTKKAPEFVSTFKPSAKLGDRLRANAGS